MTKILTMCALLIVSGFVTSCNRDEGDDEITIERQEDYNREDASETEVLPVSRDEEIKLQGDNEVDIDD